MNLISVDKISKSVGSKILFENISFGVNEGEKIALIGINGSGKTTLLNILAGVEKPDSGKVSINNDCYINYLKQFPKFDPEERIIDHIFKSNSPVVQAIKEYEFLCNNPASDENYIKKLDEMITRLDKLEAWQFESEIKSILAELGIKDLNLKMKELSGGMIKKVSLAQALIDSGNLLILDEPTNHLDINTTCWLEEYLIKTRKTIIMVTHDRYFLDNVCNVILEIDNKTIYQFNGNFSFYLEKKSEMIDTQKRENLKIQNILRNELKWLKRGAKARTTKQKARIDRIEELQQKPSFTEDTLTEFRSKSRRLGNKILEIKDISKSYDGKQVVKPFSYIFKHYERLGIVGPNGAGKSTFVKLITEMEKTDSGEVIKGINTQFAIFDQHSAALDPDKRIIDIIKEEKEVIDTPDGKFISPGKFLEMFLFPSNMHHTPVAKLSGGEKRRLHLVLLLLKNPNFLILDEPTNDLDIKTLSVLEEYLDNFQGCLIVISHDRYFMDRVVDHLFIFDGYGNIDEFPGNFTDYLAYKRENQGKSESKTQANVKSQERQQSNKSKLTYLEKKEFESIEAEIEELEKRKEELEVKLATGGTNYAELAEYQNELEKIESEILHKIERWEFLTEKSEGSD
ncbi:ABC-F family ATP-binding cassette domain-containing protein [Deferribacteraceae bacterium V6Fe1]|nr:ABC-F family ATP-binding cassette domain-containing protein [Deferribacteraceae bacterium V6Fe1]